MRFLLYVFHLLFWIGAFYLFYWVNSNFIPKDIAFAKGVYTFIIFAGTFYLHSLILVNLLLEKKKYFWYSFSAILLFIAATYFRFSITQHFPDIPFTIQLFLSKNKPFAGPFFIILFWMCFSLIYQLLINRIKREKNHLSRLNEFAKSQNQLLKSQINPHFLFNNLNNLYSLIETNSPNASQIVLKLSDILRYTVYKTTNERVSLNEELEQVKNLISLYQLKENESLNIEINELENKTEVLLEPMLLIPLVENCFKHGNYHQDADAFIFIRVICNTHTFIFEISNTTPLKKGATNEPSGFGLVNLKQRLQLIYGSKAELITQSENQVFTAKLTIVWNAK
jgi:two-component system, LytTR family, sensor kinase